MPDDSNDTAGSDCPSTSCSAIRRRFNSVGCPQLPEKPTIPEIAQWLDDLARWEELQPMGRQMDAREWAATCLKSAAEDLRQNTQTEGPAESGPSKPIKTYE